MSWDPPKFKRILRSFFSFLEFIYWEKNITTRKKVFTFYFGREKGNGTFTIHFENANVIVAFCLTTASGIEIESRVRERTTERKKLARTTHKNTRSRHILTYSVSLSRYVNIIKLRRLIFLIGDIVINSEDEKKKFCFCLQSSSKYIAFYWICQSVCVSVTNRECSPNRSIEMTLVRIWATKTNDDKHCRNRLPRSLLTASEWNMTIYRSTFIIAGEKKKRREEKWFKRHKILTRNSYLHKFEFFL